MYSILVVEDDSLLREVLAVRLQDPRLKVTTCCDGEAALQIAYSSRPDLIVTDIDMPRVSGIDLAMRLHDDPDLREVPVIVLSAHARKVTPDILARTTIREVIEKPFDAVKLQAEILSILDDAGGALNKSA